MKRIIEISEEVCRQVEDGRCPVSVMRHIIRHGTPLEEHCDGCEVGNPCLYCVHSFEKIQGSVINKWKSLYSDSEIPNKSVLDKIKAEIIDTACTFMGDTDYDDGVRFGSMLAYQYINKYTAQEGGE